MRMMDFAVFLGFQLVIWVIVVWSSVMCRIQWRRLSSPSFPFSSVFGFVQLVGRHKVLSHLVSDVVSCKSCASSHGGTSVGWIKHGWSQRQDGVTKTEVGGAVYGDETRTWRKGKGCLQGTFGGWMGWFAWLCSCRVALCFAVLNMFVIVLPVFEIISAKLSPFQRGCEDFRVSNVCLWNMFRIRL